MLARSFVSVSRYSVCNRDSSALTSSVSASPSSPEIAFRRERISDARIVSFCVVVTMDTSYRKKTERCSHRNTHRKCPTLDVSRAALRDVVLPSLYLWMDWTPVFLDMASAAERLKVRGVPRRAARVQGLNVVTFEPAGRATLPAAPAVAVEHGRPERQPARPVPVRTPATRHRDRLRWTRAGILDSAPAASVRAAETSSRAVLFTPRLHSFAFPESSFLTSDTDREADTRGLLDGSHDSGPSAAMRPQSPDVLAPL